MQITAQKKKKDNPINLAIHISNADKERKTKKLGITYEYRQSQHLNLPN